MRCVDTWYVDRDMYVSVRDELRNKRQLEA